MSSESPTPESSYPPLEKPEFKSQIPAHLLTDATPADAYILEQLSILAQTASWSVDAHIDTNAAIRRTNGRLLKAEADIAEFKEQRRFLRGGWKVLAAIGGGIIGIITLGVEIAKAVYPGN